MYETISAEQAYLEAIRAAGAAEDVNAWANKVDQIASIILARSKSFVQNENTFIHPITLEGIIVSVEENPVSQNTGNALGLFKVVFNGDNSKFPDSMWLDKNIPSDVEIFRTAQACVGKRARIEKRRKVSFTSDGKPVMDDKGDPQTSPYLRSITPLDKSVIVKEVATTDVPSEDVLVKTTPLSDISPNSAADLLELANEHLGLTPEETKAQLAKILEPLEPGTKRTLAEIKTGWVALVASNRNNFAE